MKKTLLSAALALAVVGSWAFYPNDSQPGTYMELGVSSAEGWGTLTVTMPDGKVTVAKIKETDASQARAKTVLKLNELRRDGWQVVQLVDRNIGVNGTNGYQESSFNEIYLLEKR